MKNIGIPFNFEDTYSHGKRLNFIKEAIEEYSRYRKVGKEAVRILDIGCGTGVGITFPIASLGYNIIGIDIDENSIKWANENNIYSNVSFKRGFLEKMPELSNFDIIICSEVLEHTSNPKEFMLLLKSRLQKEGILILTVPNGYGWFELEKFLYENLGLKYHPDLVIQDIYWPHLRTLATHQWQKDKSGEIVKITDSTIYITKEGILKTKDKNLFIVFLKQHSGLANFIISRLQTILFKNSLITSDLHLLDEDSFSKFHDTWEKAFESIKQTKRLLEEEKIPYVIFLIPREVQVSQNEWHPLFSSVMNEKMFSGDIPQKIFKNFAESEKVEILDFLPDFRAKYQPDLYFPIDPHLTKKDRN